jgi:hypothetical protein
LDFVELLVFAAASAGAALYCHLMNRAVILLIGAAAGVLASLLTAVDLVPRVRWVEVIMVFAGAFGAGAALTGALVEFRTIRAREPGAR